jgi:hypothetical protein
MVLRLSIMVHSLGPAAPLSWAVIGRRYATMYVYVLILTHLLPTQERATLVDSGVSPHICICSLRFSALRRFFSLRLANPCPFLPQFAKVWCISLSSNEVSATCSRDHGFQMRNKACLDAKASPETRIYSELMHGLHFQTSIVRPSEFHQTFIWQVPERDRQRPERDDWLQPGHRDIAGFS